MSGVVLCMVTRNSGVLLAQACIRTRFAHPTPKDKTWAATHEVDGVRGPQRIPIGNACEECFTISADHLFYDTFVAFCKAHKSDEGIRTVTAQVRDNLRDSSQDFAF